MARAYETVIGLEVHAQLRTETKLFCGCATAYGAPPNTQVCPVCLGLPGALPVPNAHAMELAAIAGLALGCDVRSESRFDRKNYFYPDLSKGYQISQFEHPLNLGGQLTFAVGDAEKTVRLTRIHVEEDAAKNLHGAGGGTATVVDFNRGGTPLIEIVSEPDLRSAAEAEAYLRKLRDILMFMGVNDGNLEEGSFRCDANVSVRPAGQEEFGTRTEIKNINSFKFVRQAIEYEASRQVSVIEGGGRVVQETRGWNDVTGKTVSQRSKEDAHDYRYFPDPDLPPTVFSQERIDELRRTAPKLPEQLRAEWTAQWGLTAYDAEVLTGHPAIARYFVAVAEALDAGGKEPRAEAGKRAANFIQAEVLRDVKTSGLDATFSVPVAGVADLLGRVQAGSLTGKQGKQVFAEMASSGEGAEAVITRLGVQAPISDTGALEADIRAIIAANPAQHEQYKAGKTKVLGFFVGQIMRATKGAADPATVNELLERLLQE
ncbi:MAG: Asp-tRNA(Asn)/Glu-tRNA(Gln) amidotransferase subunit GatB [Polyangiales bacterium]|nr:Asp-tRNA(Asn)/Glu-tRNA(Gln) amidotransferase subunit GatB [Myxococcales bacterium]MCB9659092.1 Asp-tRNA(Asn)/Glu-tRNA(Gln) amidotransferase subunit GatB [Sandaracinaceae bacterium]